MGFEPVPNTRSLVQQQGLMYLMLVPSPYYLLISPHADIQAVCQQFIARHIHDHINLSYNFDHDQLLTSGSAKFAQSATPVASAVKLFDTQTHESLIELYTVDGIYEPSNGYYQHSGLDIDHDQTIKTPTDSLINLQSDELLFDPDDLQISEIHFAEYVSK